MITDLCSNPDLCLQSWDLGELFYILSEEMSVKCFTQYLRYSKNLPFIVIIDHIVFNSSRSDCTALMVGLTYFNNIY